MKRNPETPPLQSPDASARETEHKPTAYLTVETEQEDAINSSLPEDSNTFKVSKLSILANDQMVNFNGHSLDLSGIKKVDIYVPGGDRKKNQKIELPENMSGRIADVISGRALENIDRFDCVSFAHFVNGLPYKFGVLDWDKWEIEHLDENDLVVGDTVMMLDVSGELTPKSIKHFGIYIGNDLYLSKFGSKGTLIVTDLDQMKKGFEANLTVKVTPRTIQAGK